MPTIDGLNKASAGVPFEGSLGKFFILENTLDLDDLDPASADVVQALPVKAGMRILLTEVESVTPADSATSAAATVGDGDAADGYDADVDLKATAGTIASTASTDTFAGVGKRYTADDTIDLVPTFTGTTTVKGKVKIRAMGVMMI